MTNPSTFPRRAFNLGAFGVCVALLGYAYYSQYYQGLNPCPLCIFQRIGMLVLGLLFLIAGMHHAARAGSRIYAVLIALTALASAGVAARHVWLQHFPPQVSECGGGLDYMLRHLPLSETLRSVFTGSGDCGVISWTFFGLSMPAWVLVWFVLLGVTGWMINWRVPHRHDEWR